MTVGILLDFFEFSFFIYKMNDNNSFHFWIVMEIDMMSSRSSFLLSKQCDSHSSWECYVPIDSLSIL